MLENRIIPIIWWFVLMVIIPWDQEKIVVVCLVIFSYLLYYMIGSTIGSNLDEKRKIIKDSLTTDIDLRVLMLRNLISNANALINNSSTQLLTLISKFNAALTVFFLAGARGGNPAFTFIAVNYTLHLVREQYKMGQTARMLSVTKALVSDN